MTADRGNAPRPVSRSPDLSSANTPVVNASSVDARFTSVMSISTYVRLSSFYFFYFALFGAWLPYWPLYLQQLGYSAASIGVLAAIMQATKVVAPNIWGWLADRTQRRLRIIRCGAFAAILVFSGIFWRQDFFWLIAIVTGYTFFWNAAHAQFEVITLGHLGAHYRYYSRIRLWGSVGFIGAVAGLGFVFDHISLNWLPWLLIALLAGIWCSSLTVSEPKPLPNAVVIKRGSFTAILRQPAVIAFFATCFLMQAAHGGYYTFFSVWLERNGYSRAATGLLWSLGVVAEIVLFWVMHHLMQRYTLRGLMLASLALTAVRWLLIAYAVTNLPLLLFAQILHAASFASYHACAVELVRRFFTGGHEGQGMAMYSGLSWGLGGTIGALISGVLWTYSPAATFALASLFALLGWLVAWRWVRIPAT
jgi:PPP family 3-phenylpropionic acid transporter